MHFSAPRLVCLLSLFVIAPFGSARIPFFKQDDKVIGETKEAMVSLWKYAARLQIETEDVMRSGARDLTPEFSERYLDLQSRVRTLHDRKDRDQLNSTQLNLLSLLDMAVVAGTNIEDCSRYRNVDKLIDAANTKFVAAFRLTEPSESCLKEFQSTENQALRDALGPAMMMKIFAPIDQKGWKPTEMGRVSRKRFEGGFRLMARMAFDVDSTGYIFGFNIDPENPARIYEVQGGMPPKGWGFQKGDVVTMVDGAAVKSIEEMKIAILATEKKMGQVTVDRKGKQVVVKINADRLAK